LAFSRPFAAKIFFLKNDEFFFKEKFSCFSKKKSHQKIMSLFLKKKIPKK